MWQNQTYLLYDFVKLELHLYYKSYISRLVMHDTADNTNTLLWAPSVAHRTSYETSIDSVHAQLIGASWLY